MDKSLKSKLHFSLICLIILGFVAIAVLAKLDTIQALFGIVAISLFASTIAIFSS